MSIFFCMLKKKPYERYIFCAVIPLKWEVTILRSLKLTDYLVKKSYVTGNLKEAVKFWKEKKVRQKGITYNAAMDTGYT